jgi:hypothetical protein
MNPPNRDVIRYFGPLPAALLLVQCPIFVDRTLLGRMDGDPFTAAVSKIEALVVRMARVAVAADLPAPLGALLVRPSAATAPQDAANPLTRQPGFPVYAI